MLLQVNPGNLYGTSDTGTFDFRVQGGSPKEA